MFACRSCGPGSIPTSGSWDCSRDRYITHFYCLAVEAGFYSDVVECLPVDPAAQVRFPPWAVGIFLHPVTVGGQYVGRDRYITHFYCLAVEAGFYSDVVECLPLDV